MGKNSIHTSYLGAVMSPQRFKRTVEAMCERAYEVMVKTSFDAIAFCGMSGAGVAFPMALQLGLPTIMVRKDDRSHHVRENVGPHQWLEGALDVDSYLIVDDQVSSGRTVATMMARIAAYNPAARCVGIILYNGCWGDDLFEVPQWLLVDLGIKGAVPAVPIYTAA